MLALIESLFQVGLKVFLVGLGAFYMTMVCVAYRSEGARSRPRLDSRTPVQSLERLAVWLGVKTLVEVSRAARPALDTLYEASAQVGGWYLHRRGTDVESFVKSRLR